MISRRIRSQFFFGGQLNRSIRSCQATWDVRCTLDRAGYLVRSSHKPKESQSSPKLLWQHTFHLDGRTARAVGFMWGRHQMHCRWKGHWHEPRACIPESRSGSSRLQTGDPLLLRRRTRLEGGNPVSRGGRSAASKTHHGIKRRPL